ncbi:sigma-54-dependent Fis family transcriptional regulator [Marinobacterium nitratireducens]|uniref:Sigma-54-dependent Fis family transcriptional regulator n=1 Tax=Marinobacterium nitratireducens TaxID=518897 RepID=A0A917ZBD1_9GAMM|nr:sigma-54 dependent transcriptional regulator [Marinobacterium nitratireducens]GGO80103.1 sigma-54-dependent Fis family transcriptional regulator [Marinobacterium nitratireducens]
MQIANKEQGRDTDSSGMAARKALFLDVSDRKRPSNFELNLQGWQLDRVTDLDSARELLRDQDYYVGLVKLDWPSINDRDEIEDFFHQDQFTAWIALTTPEVMRDHAFRRMLYENFYDYFTLPLENNESYLRATLGHAYGISRLRKLEDKQLSHLDEFHMVGASPSIMEIFKQIRKVSTAEAPVLITGESGTGKELIARAIHQRSSRHKGPFIAVNCGSLPDTLVASELFGYEKGAFTGAYKRKIGRLEAANEGTIFLDEIGDLPLDMQVHLLRFLQEQTLERLGSNSSIRVNSRVIAATNIDLEQAVENGDFREDLYYRLNVLTIRVPALRERDGDIELLARFFFQKFRSEQGCHVRGFTQQALAAMAIYDWPGNVRELINRVRRAMVMSDNRLITPADLGLDDNLYSSGQQITLEDARNSAEKQAIRQGLELSHDNVSKAARMLGVSRVTLYRLMDKYHIR